MQFIFKDMKEIDLADIKMFVEPVEFVCAPSIDKLLPAVQTVELGGSRDCPIKPGCKFQSPDGTCKAPRCPNVPR